MRLIDADALMIQYERIDWYSVSKSGGLMRGATSEDNSVIHYYDGEEVIKNAPTIEAEPVVRCKDCVNWEKATVSKNGFLICPKSGMKILARKYCSDGEKRVDDGNEADN